MKRKSIRRVSSLRCLVTSGIVALGFGSLSGEEGNTETREVIYETGFEVSEGFDPEFTLTGQGDWQAFGDGGNGLVDNFFEGQGQQAYIGLFPPEAEEPVEFFSLLRIVNISEFPEDAPLIRFEVQMEIVDSTNGQRDNFRWSIYNNRGDRLFSVDFDNELKSIAYALDDDQGLVNSEFTFDHEGSYDLVITMNYRRNLWCASLNGTVIMNALPITTKDAELTFSDADAIWAIFDPQNPGDNYMLFDNYRITRERMPSIPPKVESQGVLSGGRFVLRLFGEPLTDYRIEASENLENWTPIRTGTTSADDGTFDFVDEDAINFTSRFYRATTVE